MDVTKHGTLCTKLPPVCQKHMENHIATDEPHSCLQGIIYVYIIEMMTDIILSPLCGFFRTSFCIISYKSHSFNQN